jgi:hypothetical protein
MEYKYIIIKLVSIGDRTNKYQVVSKNNNILLGDIKWYGPWRKYCFFPSNDTIFETQCLSDIIHSLNRIQIDYKERKNK